MPRELPQELIDYTIDFLYDDRAALANCSLACRVWLPSSTLHLFTKLHTRLVSPLESPSDILDFSCLSEHPRIANNVRELHVSGRGTMDIKIASMRDILISLSCLRDIFFEDMGFILGDSPVADPGPRPAITSLHFLNPNFTTAPLRHVIASFEAIDHVHVVRDRVLTRSPRPIEDLDVAATQPRTRVHGFTIQGCNSEGTRNLLYELERCAAPGALAALALKGYSPFAALVPSVDRFLAAFPRVRRLQLLISQHGAIDANVGTCPHAVPALQLLTRPQTTPRRAWRSRPSRAARPSRRSTSRCR